MSYEYTDHDGDALRVYSFNHKVHVQTNEEGSGSATVAVAPEDAPEIALAILEAAGIKHAWDEEAQSNPGRWASKAVEALTYSVKHRAEIAEREAEDAKVREWLRIISPARFIRDTYAPSHLERQTYNAARKFFEEEQ